MLVCTWYRATRAIFRARRAIAKNTSKSVLRFAFRVVNLAGCRTAGAGGSLCAADKDQSKRTNELGDSLFHDEIPLLMRHGEPPGTATTSSNGPRATFNYRAVSDLNDQELQEFAALMRQFGKLRGTRRSEAFHHFALPRPSS